MTGPWALAVANDGQARLYAGDWDDTPVSAIMQALLLLASETGKAGVEVFTSSRGYLKYLPPGCESFVHGPLGGPARVKVFPSTKNSSTG